MAAVQKFEDADPLSCRPQTPPQFGDNRPAHRDLVRLEKAIDRFSDWLTAVKELDPGGRIDQDQRRVFLRSSSNLTFPRRARSADRLARLSSS